MADQVLTNPELMAIIPRGPKIAAAYASVKKAGKSNASPCLKKWFDCTTNPFSQSSQGACLPYGGNIDSNRYFGYLRGDIVIGTAGVGFLYVAPSPYNDCNQIWTSNANFTGVSGEFVLSSAALQPGVSVSRVPNNRFSAASVLGTAAAQRDMPVQARLVGGGIKLYYTGTELNRSGLMSIYTNPAHNCVAYNTGASTDATSLGALQETMILPVTRDPYEYPLFPQVTSELEYFSFSAGGVGAANAQTAFVYPWANGQSAQRGDGSTTTSGLAGSLAAGAVTTIVLVSGCYPGSTIHFEYGMHCEAIGDLTEGQRLAADSDPMGVDALMAAMSRFYIERNAHPTQSSAAVLKAEYSKVTANRDARVSL